MLLIVLLVKTTIFHPRYEAYRDIPCKSLEMCSSSEIGIDRRQQKVLCIAAIELGINVLLYGKLNSW